MRERTGKHGSILSSSATLASDSQDIRNPSPDSSLALTCNPDADPDFDPYPTLASIHLLCLLSIVAQQRLQCHLASLVFR